MKKPNKRLQLNAETIRKLDIKQLTLIASGALPPVSNEGVCSRNGCSTTD
jgi:hypothetical protein